MSYGNLENLYRQVIMDHYKNPRNKGLVNDDKYKEVHLKNPSCGDDITIQAKVNNKNIEDIRQDGTGCSICCASASVMSEALIGKNVDEANDIIHNYYEMIQGKEYNDDLDMGDSEVFQGVSQFPARVKCATISWKALEQAIDDKEE